MENATKDSNPDATKRAEAAERDLETVQAEKAAYMQAYVILGDAAKRLESSIRVILFAAGIPAKNHRKIFSSYKKALALCRKIIESARPIEATRQAKP